MTTTLFCVKCEGTADILSENGYCGGCFDYQDELELHIRRAVEALYMARFETEPLTRANAAIQFGKRLNALLTFSGWEVEKALRVLEIRVVTVNA
jgi:hypothetical protein